MKTITIRISEIPGGPALDWAVAIAQNWAEFPTAPGGADAFWFTDYDKGPFGETVLKESFKPSTDWAVGGPILDREKIQLQPSLGEWVASTPKAVELGGYRKYCFTSGPTLLIAAMRCFVSSKFGSDAIEIPEELLS